MKDTQILRKLIELFIHINPEPSDQQFHALAESVGVDHEYLESICYEMLGELEGARGPQLASGDPTPLSKDQLVLDGDYDPSTTSYDRVMLNDSSVGERTDEHAKEDLLNDGVPPGSDAGIEPEKAAEMNDGVVLGAATRLVRGF